MSIEGGSGIGMGGGVASVSSGTAVASPVGGAPGISSSSERGIASITISNSKGEVTFGKAEQTLIIRPINLGRTSSSPIEKSPESVNSLVNTTSPQISEAPVKPMTDEGKAQLHDDIASFLRGETTQSVKDTFHQPLDAVDDDQSSQTEESSGPQPKVRTKMVERPLQPRPEQVQRVTEAIKNPKSSKDREVKALVESANDQPESSSSPEHQDAVHEVVTEYVKKYVEPTVSPSESVRTATIELMLHSDENETSGKEGLIKKDATLAADELNRNAERAVKVIEIADAYYASIGELTPEQKAKNKELGIRSLHLANELSGTEDATKEAYKKTVEIRSQTTVTDETDIAVETNFSPNVTDQETQMTKQEELESFQESPQSVEESTEQELLQEILTEDTEVIETESEDSVTLATLENGVVKEETHEVKIVRDEETNTLRKRAVQEIGITIFSSQDTLDRQGVYGSTIASVMPEIDPPKAYISELLQNSDASNVVDGSWLQFYADIYNAGELQTENQIISLAEQASQKNTAVKVIEETTVTERQATPDEVENVFNTEKRYKRVNLQNKAA